MKNAFIFHGNSGYPEENWFPWLKKELEKIGYSVHVPQFPTPENQSPETWFKVFEKYKKFYTPKTIMIGHSLGGTFLLNVLQKYDIKTKACFFVAAPIGVLPIKNILTDKPFLKTQFDWAKIRSNSQKFFVFHSDNDPYVCLENGKELASNLQTDLTFVPNSGHFNTASGYTKFELLLDLIKKHQQ